MYDLYLLHYSISVIEKGREYLGREYLSAYGWARVKDLPLLGSPKIDVFCPYKLLVVLLIPPPLVCGMVTDQVEAEEPALLNI